jgi:pyruvate dehydrogenase E1 component alpha subunit
MRWVVAMLKNKFADEKWFDEVEAKIENIVGEAVEFAENSPWPEAEALWEDVYVQPDYPFIRE